MTILVNTNIKFLTIGQGILAAGFTSASAFTIYSGTQPTAATIAASWSSYNSTNPIFLCHYSGAIWTQLLSGTSNIASITTFPPSTAATNTGTGTWCILWPANPLIGTMNTSTIPTTSFIVGAVTTTLGTGLVRFDTDANFTATVARPVTEGRITANSP